MVVNRVDVGFHSVTLAVTLNSTGRTARVKVKVKAYFDACSNFGIGGSQWYVAASTLVITGMLLKLRQNHKKSIESSLFAYANMYLWPSLYRMCVLRLQACFLVPKKQ
jgi:hypothetical protein